MTAYAAATNEQAKDLTEVEVAQLFALVGRSGAPGPMKELSRDNNPPVLEGPPRHRQALPGVNPLVRLLLRSRIADIGAGLALMAPGSANSASRPSAPLG